MTSAPKYARIAALKAMTGARGRKLKAGDNDILPLGAARAAEKQGKAIVTELLAYENKAMRPIPNRGKAKGPMMKIQVDRPFVIVGRARMPLRGEIIEVLAEQAERFVNAGLAHYPKGIPQTVPTPPEKNPPLKKPKPPKRGEAYVPPKPQATPPPIPAKKKAPEEVPTYSSGDATLLEDGTKKQLTKRLKGLGFDLRSLGRKPKLATLKSALASALKEA